eukprot:2654637-Rhodomonas_salina.2
MHDSTARLVPVGNSHSTRRSRALRRRVQRKPNESGPGKEKDGLRGPTVARKHTFGGGIPTG